MRTSLKIILAVAAVLALPSTASASIRINTGIDGAKIGQTKTQIKAVLGNPSQTVNGMNDFGAFTEYRYTNEKLRVVFQGNAGATLLETKGLGDRTASGVGVGSTETFLKAKLAGEVCSTSGGVRSCHIGTLTAGHRVTDFFIVSGKVSRVSMGIVID